jgi:hypothetical protein
MKKTSTILMQTSIKMAIIGFISIFLLNSCTKETKEEILKEQVVALAKKYKINLNFDKNIDKSTITTNFNTLAELEQHFIEITKERQTFAEFSDNNLKLGGPGVTGVTATVNYSTNIRVNVTCQFNEVTNIVSNRNGYTVGNINWDQTGWETGGNYIRVFGQLSNNSTIAGINTPFGYNQSWEVTVFGQCVNGTFLPPFPTNGAAGGGNTQRMKFFPVVPKHIQ